jgi:energy-coupling factor transporter ATP-binding protein EcfA2
VPVLYVNPRQQIHRSRWRYTRLHAFQHARLDGRPANPLPPLAPRLRKPAVDHGAQLVGIVPRLKERENTPGGVLSGGEQQMLTLCRTLMGDPELIMIDEPTEGLAPKIVELVAEYLRELKRNNYVTPTSYLELLASFKALLDVKRSEVAAAKSRYDVGLQKLSETAASVAGMQQELQALQPQLVVARKDADALMIKIDADSKEAAKVKEVVSKDKAAAEVVAANASAIKADCEAGLAEALPALDAAVKALATLKKADIDEVKGMKVPQRAWCSRWRRCAS